MYSLNLTYNFTPLYSERLYDNDFLKTTARVSAKNEKMVKNMAGNAGFRTHPQNWGSDFAQYNGALDIACADIGEGSETLAGIG